MTSFTLGTRGSDLALAQTRHVAGLLAAAHTGIVIEEKIVRTTGDARLDISLSAPGALDKGLFTKELEEALLGGGIDAAVHSLKDLPVDQPQGLALGAILPREDPADMLVSKFPGGLEALPEGAVVATSSLRRRGFLQWRRPDADVRDIRGNVPTRLRKLREAEDLSGLVLASAGLRRLHAAGVALDLAGLHITALGFMLPAPGQGAIAVQCRAADDHTEALLAPIHDTDTAICVQAERTVLAGLGGGCHMPLGARAFIEHGMLELRAGWFAAGNPVPRLAEESGRAEAWREIAAAAVAKLTA